MVVSFTQFCLWSVDCIIWRPFTNKSVSLPSLVMLCYVVGSRRLMPPDALQPKAYCTNPGLQLHRQVSPPETLVVKGGTTWARNFDRKLRLPRIHFRVLLHSANMRHGTNGFTSLPKEGVLSIFFRPEKSDGFGRVWTREPGYQRPARYL